MSLSPYWLLLLILILLVALIVDVWRHQRAAARARLLDEIAVGVLVIDHQRRLVTMNPAAQAILGIAEIPDGRPIDQLLAAQPDLARLLATTPTEDDADGEEIEVPGVPVRHVQLRRQVMRNRRGEPDGLMATLVDISAWRQATHESDNTTAIIAAAMENAAPPLALVTAGAPVVRYANGAFRTLLEIDGASSPDKPTLTDLSLLRLIWDAGDGRTPDARSLLQRACAGETVGPQASQIIRNDGSQRWHLLSAGPVYDSAGALIAAYISAPDITALKADQAALAESELLYRTLVESMLDGVFLIQSNKIVFTNAAFAAMIGYTPAEMLSATFDDFLVRTDAGPGPFQNDNPLDEPMPSTYEMCMRHRDGSPVYVNTSIRAISYDGRLTLVGAVQDIGERRKLDEILRVQQAEERLVARRLEILHALSVELLQARNPVDLCRQAVRRGCGEIGFDRLGIWLADATNPQLLHGTFAIDEAGKLRDERDLVFDISNDEQVDWPALVEGRDLVLALSARTIQDRGGAPIGVADRAIAAMWDGTVCIGYIFMDNLLQRAPLTRKTLQLLVLYARIVGHLYANKRTLQNLELARNAAEAANRARSIFVTNVNHETRTSMNAVIGMTSLLLDSPLTPQQRDFVETIRSSSNSLLTVLNELLDFSKIEFTNAELVEEEFSLSACIEESLDVYAVRAAEKGLDLIYQQPTDLPDRWHGDLGRLRQVLVNLIGNALKLTEHGEIEVTVEGQPSADGYLVRFGVRDTGAGIPSDRMESIFDFAVRSEQGANHDYIGAGLGLPICRRLVELMGGSIWVESQPGAGSHFHFQIPLRGSTTDTAVARSPAPPELAGKRILFVDANLTLLRNVSALLIAWGARPALASSLDEAERLAELESERFAVAVIEIPATLPGSTGEDEETRLNAISAVRRRLPALACPVILLVAASSSTLDGQARKLGFAGQLTKPLKAAQLQALLVSTLEHPDAGAYQLAPKPIFDTEFAAQHPLRILLVEDNVINQKVTLRILERLGYAADLAVNGRDAVLAVERGQYDLLLMDIQMPEMDGLQATQAIRARLPAARQPVIIALTAVASRENQRACLEAGMDAFMSKPVRSEDLTAALRMTRH